MLLRFAFVIALLSAWPSSLHSEVLYSVTEIGTLGGFTSGRGVNASGMVVGESDITSGAYQYHAFLWNGAAISDLGTFGGPQSDALGINNRGQVTGWASTSPTEADAFLYANGQMIDLGPGFGAAINDRGQITGGGLHAFLYSDGQRIDLGTLGGSTSDGRAINDFGDVVGESQTANPFFLHAFLYTSGRMLDLGTLGGHSEAWGINNHGQVTGQSVTTSGLWHAFLYSNGQMIDLTPGDLEGAGFAINDDGWVTGYIGGSAFLYANGHLMYLDSLVDPGLGIRLLTGTAFNSNGQILVNGLDGSGQGRAFLLTPVPEPRLLLGLGLALLFLPWLRKHPA